MSIRSKKLALTGILLSLALIIGVVENYIPPIIPYLPFIKIGLSNVVLLFACITIGFFPTITISLFKSILVPIFVGNPMMIAYSLSASLVSTTFSYLLLRTKKIGLPTIGIIGAITHNIIQLCIACLIMSDILVFGFLPYLVLTGGIAGVLTGLITYLLIKYMPEKIFHQK